MATVESGVVRSYRDIEGDERKTQDALQDIVRMRKKIIDLDEKIYATGHDVLQLAPLDLLAIQCWQRAIETLDRCIEITDETIVELQQRLRRPLTLERYLDACHSFDTAMSARDILVPALELRQQLVRPKVYPRYVFPSPHFATKQLDIWSKLAGNAALSTEACYPSIGDLEWLREGLDSRHVGCQWSLFKFMSSAVDEAVTNIMDRITQDEHLVSRLEIDDFIQPVFEPFIVTTRTPLDNGMSTMSAYRRTNQQRVPLLVTSYRPPHRLSLNEILMGLQGHIYVEQDVIGRIGDGMAFTSRCLVTAVITQLFHRMLEVGTQFGYISTGEALVFVEIPEAHPTCAYYSICVPRQDVEADAETGLHRTAVAQVLAFTLRALTARRMTPMWYTEAQSLEKWDMHPDNVFNRIPPLLRKRRRDIQCLPRSWGPFVEESPIRQRPDSMFWPGSKRRSNEVDFNDFGVFKFLSIHTIDPEGERIDQRPFCSQSCVLGIARGGALDEECPNFRYHGDKHMSRAEFLKRLQTQLEVDVEKEDCANLQSICRSGPYTALFKVRLASHGYTLLMKGVIRFKVSHLRHEIDMYDRMSEIQGVYVPVCLGMVQTPDPISKYHGDYASFMVLGGLPDGLMPLRQCVTGGVDKCELVDAVDTAFEEIHKLRVLQFDPEARNMLYDAKGKRAMIADFEKAVFDTFEGQQFLDMSVVKVGAGTQYAVRAKISDGLFAQERAYVRDRVVEFCESNY